MIPQEKKVSHIVILETQKTILMKTPAKFFRSTVVKFLINLSEKKRTESSSGHVKIS